MPRFSPRCLDLDQSAGVPERRDCAQDSRDRTARHDDLDNLKPIEASCRGGGAPIFASNDNG